MDLKKIENKRILEPNKPIVITNLILSLLVIVNKAFYIWRLNQWLENQVKITLD